MKTSEEMVVILTECTLATIEGMALRKNPPKGEFERQKMIAQTGVDFVMNRAIKTSGRVLEVISDYNGNVSAWANDQRGIR